MLQIPGLEEMHTRTSFVVKKISSQWNKIKSLILVDRTKFPEKSHRFTAIYSRDREYLLVLQEIDNTAYKDIVLLDLMLILLVFSHLQFILV